jgi:hypothetical protein
VARDPAGEDATQLQQGDAEQQCGSEPWNEGAPLRLEVDVDGHGGEQHDAKEKSVPDGRG